MNCKGVEFSQQRFKPPSKSFEYLEISEGLIWLLFWKRTPWIKILSRILVSENNGKFSCKAKINHINGFLGKMLILSSKKIWDLKLLEKVKFLLRHYIEKPVHCTRFKKKFRLQPLAKEELFSLRSEKVKPIFSFIVPSLKVCGTKCWTTSNCSGVIQQVWIRLSFISSLATFSQGLIFVVSLFTTVLWELF